MRPVIMFKFCPLLIASCYWFRIGDYCSRNKDQSVLIQSTLPSSYHLVLRAGAESTLKDLVLDNLPITENIERPREEDLASSLRTLKDLVRKISLHH